MDYTGLIIIGIILLLLGSGALIAGLYTFWLRRCLTEEGVKTTAKIIGFRSINRLGTKTIDEVISNRRAVPVIEFITEEGKEIQVESKFGNQSLSSWKKGQMVEIYYDRKKPTRFYITDDRTPVIFGSVMLICGVLGLIIIPYLYISLI